MVQGGVETVVCDLNRALLGAGDESVVVSKGGPLAEVVKADGGRHVEMDLKTKNPFTYFTRAWKLRKLLRAERPDIVCAHSRVPAWLFVWANRGLGFKWITYAHGANSVSRYSEVMTKGNLIVTPSKFLAEYLMSNYPVDGAKIRVVPNAVDTERFDPSRLDTRLVATLRRKWGIGDGDHVTMSIGRITPVKGFDSLIREFSAKYNGADGHKLVIVGGADRHHRKYLAELEALVERLNPNPSSVVFAGQQTSMPECLSIADEVVSANTTKPESFGLSIVEAYSMNKPVRAKRFGGAAEIMEAVVALYGMKAFYDRSLSVYRELYNMV